MPHYKYDHLHLVSQDPEKTARFYTEMLGAEKINDENIPEDGSVVRLTMPGVNIIISKPGGPQPENGLDHWGIATDNIEETVKEMKSAGIKFQQEITQFLPNLKLAFFWAPDNVLIELMEYRE